MSDLRWGLEFTHPEWLLGLIALPWLWWCFRRSLVDFSFGQRAASLAVRSLMVLLLVLAMAGLTLLRPTSRQFVIVAIDQSVSVGDDSTHRLIADKFLKEARAASPLTSEDRILYLPFAATPGTVSDRSGTNIAAAIEAAAAAMPPDYVPRIVLLTDGNQTSGDALQAALATANRHQRREAIPITTVPLPTRDDPEVQLSAVRVPAQVREGEPFHVEVIVDANHDDEGLIEVFRGGHKVVAERKPVTKGENRFRFPQSIQKERLAEYTARISEVSQDTLLDNNSDSGLVFTSGTPRVLLIDSDPKQTQHLVFALQQEDIQVDVRAPEGLPEDLSDLQNYELLALSNVPATALTQRQMELARTYVQELGGGFLMLGGDQSFGLGGYFKTTLEDILPVRSDFEKEKEKPSLAMVLVIDRSGSMAGEKLEMAKAAGRATAELLTAKDQLGVIVFDEAFAWTSEFQSAANKGRILDDIAGITIGGGTSMYPAMEEAHQTLTNAVAKLKHVIMLTDGISSPGDFEGLAQDMVAARITCSTVGVGDGAANELLATIARIAQGRHFVATDPSSLPQIFAKETLTASKAAIKEEPFLPQVMRPTSALAGIDFESAPFLLGYVLTKPKATCELILASEQGDPLLAWWRYGLGTSVAFTSDASSRWAAEWLTWPEFSRFWAQVVRHAMRKNDAKGVTVEIQQRDRRATLTLDAIDISGRFLNHADSELTLIDPRLGQFKLPLPQIAPGRYVAEFETPQAGAYHLHVSQKSFRDGPLLNQQSRGLTVSYSAELRLRPTNVELLKQIADVTGGRFSPSASEVFQSDMVGDAHPAGTRPAVQQTKSLWQELLMLGLVLFVADVALRRIDFRSPIRASEPEQATVVRRSTSGTKSHDFSHDRIQS